MSVAIRTGVILILTLILSGCQAPAVIRAPIEKAASPLFPAYAAPGIKSTMERIVPGKSQRADVFNLLGPPTSIDSTTEIARGIELAARPAVPAGTRESWSYYLNEVRNRFALDPRPLQFHTATAVFYFDSRGKVIDYRVSERTY